MRSIAGVLDFNEKPLESVHLVRMANQLRHRGPDDLGICADRLAGPAHTRLNVTDLASGQQPMANEDKSVSIIFSEEIFKCLELKKIRSRGRKKPSQEE